MKSDICNTCKNVFLVTELMKDAARSKGYRNKCRGCLREQSRIAYGERLSRPVREYRHDRRVRNILEKKEMLDALREVPCLDCGGRFPTCAMDFDHMRNKLFGIMGSYMSKTMEQLLDEVEKCEIVCSNCHRIRTKLRRH